MGFLTRCKRPFLFAFLLQFCNMLVSFFLKTFLILFEKQQLVARVKAMLRRYLALGTLAGAPARENVVTLGGLSLDLDEKQLTVDGAPVRLTATEYRIVALLMQNPGRVYNAEEIYERVWNEPGFSVENTVMVHIRRIREKIEINPKNPKYLKVVWGLGYKMEKAQ